jgi:hypothetical protein
MFGLGLAVPISLGGYLRLWTLGFTFSGVTGLCVKMAGFEKERRLRKSLGLVSNHKLSEFAPQVIWSHEHKVKASWRHPFLKSIQGKRLRWILCEKLLIEIESEFWYCPRVGCVKRMEFLKKSLCI